mmetsp:Transcript_50175/g.56840  ORF Transcript_50175/g.56840 Transcript_50175/m.56840 type:complete len:86 (+) Transcript_50175:3-260(+)
MGSENVLLSCDVIMPVTSLTVLLHSTPLHSTPTDGVYINSDSVVCVILEEKENKRKKKEMIERETEIEAEGKREVKKNVGGNDVS